MIALGASRAHLCSFDQAVLFHPTRIIFDRPGKICPCAAQPLRVVRVATDKRHPDGMPVEMGLVTNRLDLAADLIAVTYRYR